MYVQMHMLPACGDVPSIHLTLTTPSFDSLMKLKEFTILLVRMLFPLHPICAAIQSVYVVRRDVENDSRATLGRSILLPVVLIHGCFDWILMMGDFFNFSLTAVMLALAIVLTSWYFYHVEAKLQRQRLQGRDQQINVDQSTLL